MIVFSALWLGVPLLILGIVGVLMACIVPMERQPKSWWLLLGSCYGAALVGGIWIVSVNA